MAFETTRLSQAQGLTGADIAFMCQRAAMFCVKEAAGGSSKLQEMSEDADLFNQDETAPQSIRRRRAGEVHCSLGRWPECLFSEIGRASRREVSGSSSDVCSSDLRGRRPVQSR